MKRNCLDIQPSFWILSVVGLLLLPFRWIIAWMIAVSVHEIGHYLALRALKIPVYTVSIRLSGVYLQTAPMTAMQEAFVAAAGPIFSFMLVGLARWIPHTACCAFFHLIFNMLPFSTFDGGRVLENILRIFLPEQYAAGAVRCIQCLLLAFIGGILLYLRWGLMLIVSAAMLLVRNGCVTFPCKQRKQIVQWSKRPK